MEEKKSEKISPKYADLAQRKKQIVLTHPYLINITEAIHHADALWQATNQEIAYSEIWNAERMLMRALHIRMMQKKYMFEEFFLKASEILWSVILGGADIYEALELENNETAEDKEVLKCFSIAVALCGGIESMTDVSASILMRYILASEWDSAYTPTTAQGEKADGSTKPKEKNDSNVPQFGRMERTPRQSHRKKQDDYIMRQECTVKEDPNGLCFCPTPDNNEQ